MITLLLILGYVPLVIYCKLLAVRIQSLKGRLEHEKRMREQEAKARAHHDKVASAVAVAGNNPNVDDWLRGKE